MEKQTGRNSYDVAMELVNLHFSKLASASYQITEEEIERVYLKYYKLVRENR
ncbi:hypothetical protein [Sporosarcina sp. 6E9]|uniref:hypothetical protein n=1 Tax=Sporosarcina sp. 6E9 TaxID=2819235 RepID=UPI001AC7C310|nr:hypothetical protein [Sporosarcina sp. 6E9]MBO1909709.1 hypothetical protein [Microvirga sp. 3-52]